MRSLLFVPGNVERMLEKALDFTPDAYVPDLEDSVPDAEKRNARNLVSTHLPRLSSRGVAVIPRLNAHQTQWFEDDLAAVIGPHVYGISIGKIGTAEEITWISDAIAECAKPGWVMG